MCEAIFPLECHHGPSSQACLILSKLIVNKILRGVPKGYQAGASLLHTAKVLVDVMCYHQMDIRLAPLEQLIEPIDIPLVAHVEPMFIVGRNIYL